MSSAHFGPISCAGGWRPSSPNNGSTIALVGWFSALDPTAFTAVDVDVVTVKNKVSGVNATTVTNVKLGAINGKPAFVGNGVDSKILTTEALPLTAFTGHQAFTVLVVCRSNDYSNNPRVWSAGDSANALHQQDFGQFNVNGGIWEASRKGPVFATRFESPLGASVYTPNIHTTQYFGTGFAAADGSGSGADLTHRLNDGAVDSVLGGDLNYDRDDITGANTFAMFCLFGLTPAAFYNGAIGEILIYKGAISTTHIASAVRFLNNRWLVSRPPPPVVGQRRSLPPPGTFPPLTSRSRA